jgi:hypothetical protein
MFMRSVYRFTTLALTAILFYQCQKEVSFVGTGDPGQVILPSPLKANLQGNVLDENGQPAENVVIKVGSEFTTTDAKGYFRMNNAALDKNAALVSAQKAGYFAAYRTFNATSGTNQVVIKLIKKNLSGTVSATNGGDVTLTNGTKISLPGNGIVKTSDNSSYTGTVNVYASFIDPTAADILERVPGSFMANDKDGKRVFLTSYGMMAVELESAAGEKLQIKSNNTATLTYAIPSALQSTSPASIPLWYVDEATGLWKEEGVATKQGNNYVGTVQHFSFWNCDIGVPAITLSTTLKTSKGLPLVNASVVITADKYGSASGYTDSLGQVKGLVPANTNLTLQVRDNCGATIYSKNLGSQNKDVDLGAITVTPTSQSLVTVSGKLTNCSGANVTKGYAIISINNYVRYAKVDASGNFTTNYLLCSITGNMQVLGVDETTQQQGNVSTVTVAAPTTDVGTISACGTSSTQFINYTLDGTQYTISELDSLTAFTNTQTTPFTSYISGFQMSGSNATNTISFKFDHSGYVTGSYPIVTFSVRNLNNPTPIQPFNVTMTSMPQAVGQFYEGSLNGQVKDASNVTHTISCSFRIRRTF